MNTEDKIYELRDQNATDLHELEKIRGMIEAEKRHLTADEVTRFDALTKSIESRNSEIESIQKTSECLSRMDSVIQDGNKRSTNMERLGTNQPMPTALTAEIAERENAFENYLKRGTHIGDFEMRALNQTEASEGGYLIPPEKFVANILRELDLQVVMRKLARVLPPLVGFQSIGIPTMDSDLGDYDWLPEQGVATEDTGITFGKRVMTVNQLKKEVQINKMLIYNSAINPSQIVQERLVYRLGITQEFHSLYGNGNKQPLGIFTESSSGIDVTRDCVVGTATEAITYDGLVAARAGLKSGYLRNAVWLFSSGVVIELMKMKDKNGRPIWTESIKQGEPSMLLGIPVVIADLISPSLVAGNFCGCLADFSYYWILDSKQFELQVLHELEARKNNIVYLANYWGDAQPVMKNAFVRLLPFATSASANQRPVATRAASLKAGTASKASSAEPPKE